MDGYNKFFKDARKSGQQKKQFPTDSMNEKVPKTTPEQQLKNLLAQKRMAKQKQRRARQRFPWVAVTISIFFVTGLVVGAFRYSSIEEIVAKIQVFPIGSLIAAETASGKNLPGPTAETAEKKSPTPAVAVSPPAATETPSGEGEVNHFNKLGERKKELDQREQELNELEEELHKQMVEIESRIQHLETVRREIASTLKEKVELDDKKVDTLVEFYSNMKPSKAAEVLNTIDENLAVEVLGRMKKKNAAEILNLMKADKAQTLSEKYAGYKRR